MFNKTWIKIVNSKKKGAKWLTWALAGIACAFLKNFPTSVNHKEQVGLDSFQGLFFFLKSIILLPFSKPLFPNLKVGTG